MKTHMSIYQLGTC